MQTLTTSQLTVNICFLNFRLQSQVDENQKLREEILKKLAYLEAELDDTEEGN